MGAWMFVFVQMWNSNNNFGEIKQNLMQAPNVDGAVFLSIYETQ